MKLFQARALLYASRAVRQLRGTQCNASPPITSSLRLPPPRQWHPYRTLTNATANPQPEHQPSNNSNPQNQQSLSDQVRLLMRRVPYPVAIITATDPNRTTPPESAFRGMTVSSLNTVTLTPAPVISFNVRRPSETLAALLSSGRFLVHLLAPHPATAALARDFSRGNHNLAITGGKSDFEFSPYQPEPSSGVGDDSLPLPLLREKAVSRGAGIEEETGFFPFVFECRLHPQRVDVCDHTIVVGTIVRALSSSSSSSSSSSPSIDTSETSSSAADLCLTYANTRFWEMGREI